MSIGRRILVAVAVVVAINVAGATTAFFVVTRRAHPDTRGRVTVAGLDEPVEILRDENGVPHIYAETTRDMYFAQGYVHAQDRFWQMEFWRRIGAGRLSELLGEATLSTDIFLRTMGFADLAAQEYERMSPEVRAALDAYADGVNAYIGGRRPGQLSLEHGLLALQGVDVEIEPWRPENTLTWLKIMSYDLGQNLQTELDTLALVRAVGTELAAEYFPEYGDDMPYIVNRAELERHLGPELAGGAADGATATGSAAPAAEGTPGAAPGGEALTDLAALLTAAGDTAFVGDAAPPHGLAFGSGNGLGSNNWVIGGSRTESGMPILANDPHLGIQMPSIWYEVALHSAEEDLTVAGFSFAGAPGVIIGHNDRIAWGVTNLAPDVQDVYMERINPADPTEYEVNGAWREMTVRTEEIGVAGRAEPHVIRVRETRNGPLITDLASNAEFRGFGVDLPEVSADGLGLTELSLRWTALEPNRTLESIYHLNRAADFSSFREALALFDVPAQNFVYADTEGNIGYQAPGLIPVRRGGTGRLPAPGWTDAYQWEGYIPFEELPYVYNPQKDYVVTANNPVVPEGYPYLLATEFNHGYRARRIVDLIEAGGNDITLDDVAAMHGDTYNLLFESLRPVLQDLDVRVDGDAVDEDGEAPGAALSAARDMLLEWDGRMDTDSAEAALYAFFYQHLVEGLFLDQIPAELWDTSPRIGEGSRVQSVIENLLSDPRSRWWDDVLTPDRTEQRDDIFRRALSEARAAGEARFDAPPADWEWGAIHTAEFRNQSLGQSGIGVIERLFNRGPVAVGGGMQQVLSADWDFREPYEVNLLSSMRQIIDLSDLDASRMSHTTGQSGHPFHRHYDDLMEPWARVEYHPHYFSREALETTRLRRLELAPAD